jgi:AraC-like DNA-binding protein
MPPPSSGILLDPGTLALWALFQRFAGAGIRTLVQWGPQDGLGFPATQRCHQHAVPTVIACLAGSIQVQGRTALDLLPGDLLLIEPGCWHDQPRTRPGCCGFGIGFIAGWCDVVFFDSVEKRWGKVPEQPYRGLVDALMGEAFPAERLRLVDEILGALTGERIAFLDWIQPSVMAMAEHLWCHLHLRLDVDAMVASSQLGRTAGYRLFKEFFHRSPKQELIAQRIALARHLLARGFAPGEAAARSGFASRMELARSIRTHLGLSLAELPGARPPPR